MSDAKLTHKRCQCRGCGQIFSTVSLFDKHRGAYIHKYLVDFIGDLFFIKVLDSLAGKSIVRIMEAELMAST